MWGRIDHQDHLFWLQVWSSTANTFGPIVGPHEVTYSVWVQTCWRFQYVY